MAAAAALFVSSPLGAHVAAALPPPSFGVLFNESFPVAGIVFNPWPPAGCVEFDGRGHEVITGETSPTSEDIIIHFNFQGVNGVGLASGDVYQIPDNSKTDICSRSGSRAMVFAPAFLPPHQTLGAKPLARPGGPSRNATRGERRFRSAAPPLALLTEASPFASVESLGRTWRRRLRRHGF